MKIKFLAIALLFHSIALISQDNNQLVILDMQIPGDVTNMINQKGKVVKVFSADERVKLSDKRTEAFKTLSMFSTFVSYDFNNGPLPVQNGNNWSLYNIEGKQIIDFKDRFESITVPSEGNYRVFESIEGSRSSSWIYYIDQYGKELFDGKRFWEATAIKGNIGFAQLDNKNGEWVKLNVLEGTIEPFNTTSKLKIHRIIRETDRLCRITFKSGSHYPSAIMDLEGNILFESNEIPGRKFHSFYRIADDMSICYDQNGKYYFLNDAFDIEKEMSPLLGIYGVSSNMILTNNGQYFDNIYDRNFNKVKLPLNDSCIFLSDFLSDNYLSGIVIDTFSRTGQFTVFDNRTLEILHSTERPIGTMVGDLMVEIDPGSKISKKLVSLIDLKGNVVYQIDPSRKIFQSIKSTESYSPKDVRHLELISNEDISKLEEFVNLESIQFAFYSFSEVPETIKSFKKLESISFSNCENITELPKWFLKYKKLNNLSITDCKNLKNLESVIEGIPGLTKVYTMNYKFEEGFKDMMKEKNPNLEIDSWSGF